MFALWLKFGRFVKFSRWVRILLIGYTLRDRESGRRAPLADSSFGTKIVTCLASRDCGSVDVALITPSPRQLGKIGLGSGERHRAFLGDDPGERGVDVLRHTLCVAADIDRSAVLQPRPERRGLLAHPMLDIELLGLVAREGGVEAAQQAIGDIALKLLLIEKIEFAPLIAEEQPVATARADRAALLEKGAGRRDAGAGTDHDDRRIVFLRQAEAVRRPHPDLALGPRATPPGKIARGDALAPPASLLIAHPGDGEMHLIRFHLRRRSDRVEARLQSVERQHQLL